MKNMTLTATVLVTGLVLLGGCAEMDHRQRSTATGAAIGAGAGAIIGNQSGNPITGAVIGGAAGAVVGNQVAK